MSNKVISIEYSLQDANTKEQLDSNIGAKPLEFISNMGQIIPGLEKELVNLKEGDKTDVLVQPSEAYGEYNEEALQTVPKEQFTDVDLVVGMTLYGTGENEESVQVIVKDINDNEVTIDFNHPMAGKSLMFSVEVLAVRDATDEEIQVGVVGGIAATGGSCCGGGHCDEPEEKIEHNHDNGGCCGGGHCS